MLMLWRSSTRPALKPEPAMQFFSVSQQPSSVAKPPVAQPAVPELQPAPVQDLMKPERCGWYDSSFELAAGLEISVQDDDVLYQLCEVFLH
jgi:hypothetical protein